MPERVEMVRAELSQRMAIRRGGARGRCIRVQTVKKGDGVAGHLLEPSVEVVEDTLLGEGVALGRALLDISLRVQA